MGKQNHERAKFLTVANLLTLLRILLIWPFVYLIALGNHGAALAVFFLASVSDFGDGYIARRFGQQTAVGRFLDPLADKALTTAAYVVMALPRPAVPSIPIWLSAAVIGRDVLILAGSLVIYFAIGYREFKPSMAGKVNTTVELGLIVYFLAVHAFEALAFLKAPLTLCYFVVLGTVIVSSISYARIGRSIIKEEIKKKEVENNR
ncbi:MAG TPA: CDP-alcohol phosphatidyltransferase family protein [Blastocatellia bacterium]|nr:CDP-alcohol phosphatidyltransferase family protein [Blastocatellia bacterium]